MPSGATSETGSGIVLPPATFYFRCIACSASAQSASQDFRCAQCGNLLEITDPSWRPGKLDAHTLKSIWHERRSSNTLLDRSGVWRFRELLPIPASEQHVVTLREG